MASSTPPATETAPCPEELGPCNSCNNSATPSTSINIGQVLVYNFSSGSERSRHEDSPRRSGNCSLLEAIRQGHKKLTSYLRSLSNTSNPICRICHDGDGVERLVAPCYCSGTMGMVHVTCMERWLSSINADKCELCHYKFKTYKTPKPFQEWLRDSNRTGQQRSLVGDIICFFLLTPLAVVSGFLCIDGALHQASLGNQMEAGSLVALSSVLLSVYVVWTGLACRFYYRHWKEWQASNQNVRMLSIRRISRPSNEDYPPRRWSFSTNHTNSPVFTESPTVTDSESSTPTGVQVTSC